MLQTQFSGRPGDSPGFVRVRRRRALLLGDGAKGAVAGAGLSENQEGGRALAETLSLVGTESSLADGVETVALEKGAHFVEGLRVGELSSQPFGFIGRLSADRGLKRNRHAEDLGKGLNHP